MTREEKDVILSFEKCDFTKINTHLQAVRERKKLEKKESKEIKQRLKQKTETEMATYGFALVDGFLEKVGNFRVEPPALFRGRGAHPKTGKVKHRVMPEDVVLNIGPGQTIPKCPLEGHNWKGVVHNNQVLQ